MMTDFADFHSNHYLRLNQRRQEHLVSLRLDLKSRSVLEMGAGIGDHTPFFLDRDCEVLSLEVRDENLERLGDNIVEYYGFYESDRPGRHRWLKFDLERDDWTKLGSYDLAYCYGVLYHLQDPGRAIELMGDCCGLGLVETCVSFGREAELIAVSEDASAQSQSVRGKGCRPTRAWMFRALKMTFPFVYMPLTQPNHEEFPLDWTQPPPDNLLTRAVFIGAKEKIDNANLCDFVPEKQVRCP
jgi:hypothetical protein